MAERRMFSKRIISSDAFMDMSASAQMLYFHLSMWADDEGFVNNPKTIQRMCGATSEDMSALIKSGLVIRFESGIIAITHWKTHNYIRGDRIKPTFCTDEKALLCVSEDGVYSFAEQNSENAGEPERDYEADSSAQAESFALNGNGTGAESSAQAKDSTRNGSGTGAESSAQSESSAQNGSGTVADTSAQSENSTQNGSGTVANNSAQAKDSTINGNGAGAESSAQAKDSTRNDIGAGADNSTQAKDSNRNDNGAGAESSAQAKDSTRNDIGAGAESSAQVKDSTRKGEKCDKETLIEKYGIVNVLQYEDRFKKWAEKRGRQGMPLYPTISAWMEQDKVVNSGEYSSIPDYYLSDDFLLEGF